MLAGVGLLLNLRLGPSPMHYAMVIAAALGGMLASGRQVLLHIAPGDPGYGTTLLGLHFYTWSFIAFVALIAFCVLMLSADRKWGDSMLKQVPRGLARHGPVFRHRAGQSGRHDAGMRFRALPGQSDGYLWLDSLRLR